MRVRLEHGDCLNVLRSLAAEGVTVDSVVTDPPYHLTSIVRRFSKSAESDDTQTSDRVRRRADGMARLSRGFMGKQWDGGDVAFRPETWAAVGAVMKPGAHLLAFAGTRTYHRMACAIEDAGFEIRDQIGWLYGSGFPKSHNLDGEWEGWGTALKPAWEPICVARKPLIGTVARNVLEHGTGAINIDGCRIEATDKTPAPVGQYGGSAVGPVGHSGIRDNSADDLGRWPANVIHDGSYEVLDAFPNAPGQLADASNNNNKRKTQNVYGAMTRGSGGSPARGDSGSAARFFYCAKAAKAERAGSKHPTVKPLALMRYLVRLVTPPGGLVLDPFAGSGSTGEAALLEGFDALLIEREAEYVTDIRRRLDNLSGMATIDPKEPSLFSGVA